MYKIVPSNKLLYQRYELTWKSTFLKGTGIAQWYSYGLRAEWSEVQVPIGLEIFLLTTTSRPTLGPTQPPIQWVTAALSVEVKRPVCEADHSPPSSAKVKNAWSYTSTPPVRLHGVCLVKVQGQFYLSLYTFLNIYFIKYLYIFSDKLCCLI
jgi:hypothetical protein